MFDPIAPSSYILQAPWQIFVAGFAGGISGDLIGIWAARHTGKLPDYARSPLFWASAIGMAIAGGVMALAYGFPQKLILVLNIGASAPLLIQSLARGVPKRAARRRSRATAKKSNPKVG